MKFILYPALFIFLYSCHGSKSLANSEKNDSTVQAKDSSQTTGSRYQIKKTNTSSHNAININDNSTQNNTSPNGTRAKKQ